MMPDDNDNKLTTTMSRRIRRARVHRGLTQWEVAERLGISETFFARIERGTARPTLPRFARLVMVLGVSADSLLNNEGAIVYRDDRLLRWPHDDASAEVRRIYRRLQNAPERLLELIAHILDALEPRDPAMTPSES